MTILPRSPEQAPPAGFRPAMPLRVKLEAALLALGLTPIDVEYDHSPPLQMRVWIPEKGDTEPPANDPRFIVPRPRADHREKTSGRSTKARAEGDQTEIARTRRLSQAQMETRRRMLAKDAGEEPKPRGKRAWPKRPFPKRRKP